MVTSSDSTKRVPWKVLNRMIDDDWLPELQKIKSKQRRRDHEKVVLFNDIDWENQSLEKHIDGEIFIPKNL